MDPKCSEALDCVRAHRDSAKVTGQDSVPLEENTCWGRAYVLVAGLCLCGLLLFWQVGVAQINTGQIVGFVTDASGAAIPGAQVRTTNVATGVLSVSSTNQSGAYLVNYLVPGTYQLEIARQGFATVAQTGVMVTAGKSTRLDIQLRVGAVHQVVQVTAQPAAVNTQNAQEKFTFSTADVQTLPNIDRNPLMELNLLPGAQSGSGSGNYGTNGGEDGSAVALTNPQLAGFGGMDANANTVYIDGIPTREPQNAYIGLVPPEDGIEELDVYTGKYDAEYGQSASGVINVVTKSGTNQFHGDAFEYMENDALDAIPFFATSTTPFKRNQFGGSMGGPIKKDKLFFFADFQRTPDLQDSPVIASAPTALMYNGDFSQLYVPGQTDSQGNTLGQLYNPFTRVFNTQGNQVSVQPLSGNIISSNLWDPVSAKMVADHVFGVPNLPGIVNNLYYLNAINQYTNQGDARIDYSISDSSKVFFHYSALGATLENPPTVNPFIENSANNGTLNQNMGLTFDHMFSPALMNDFRLGYNRTHVNTSNNTETVPYNNEFGIPDGNPAGAGTGTGLAEFLGVDPYSELGQPDWVAFIVSNTISLSDSLTWVKGKHTLKFGTLINHVEDTSADTIGGDDPRGGFYFSPEMTSYNGSALDYGFPSFLLGTPVESERTQFSFGFPYQTYWEDGYYGQDDFQVTRSLNLNLGLRWDYYSLPIERFNRQSNWDTQTNQLVVASAGNRSPGITPDYHDLEPRLGFAWSPDHGKTSIRGGWGVSYYQNYWGFSPFSNGSVPALTVLGATYPFYDRQEYLTPNDLTPSLTLSANGLPPAIPQKNSQGEFTLPAGAEIRGVDYNWKNQKVSQYTFDVERQVTSGLVLDVGYLGVYGGNEAESVNINQAPPSPIIGINYILNQPLNSKYPGLGSVPISESIASTNYNALTASLRGHLGRNLQVLANFAYSRSLSNGFNFDPFEIGQYYGPANDNLPFVFNSQIAYSLPFGRGQGLFSNDGSLVDEFIGGWKSSAFITIQSGYPFTVSSPVSLLNNGQANRPNLIAGCHPNLSNPTLQDWFNAACFVNDLVPGTYGTEGTNMLQADGLQQVNFSIFKSFKITERYNLRFEADFQNLFNHPNYGFPDATVGDPAIGAVTSATVTSRIIQLGLRFSF